VTEDVNDKVLIVDDTLDLDVLSDDNNNLKQSKKIISSQNIGKKKLFDFKDKKKAIPNLISPKFGGPGRINFLRKITGKNKKPLEEIEEEHVVEKKRNDFSRQSSQEFNSMKEEDSGSGFLGSPQKRIYESPVKKPITDMKKPTTLNINTSTQKNLVYNLQQGRKDSSIIGDIMLTMNSKKKLKISCWEFLGIALCFHRCSKDLKKKNDLYQQSLNKLQNMHDSNYMMEKFYEIEKMKYLMFNNLQNYAFSFLTKPLIIFTDEGKIVVQNDIIKSRNEYKLDASKEESIKHLLRNQYNCQHINQKLLKLIRVNN